LLTHQPLHQVRKAFDQNISVILREVVHFYLVLLLLMLMLVLLFLVILMLLLLLLTFSLKAV